MNQPQRDGTPPELTRDGSTQRRVESQTSSRGPSGFLPSLPATVAPAGGVVGDEQAVPPKPPLPDRIGRYRITGTLGRGAFGTVCRAHDDELDRTVALKIPHPPQDATGLPDEQQQQPTLREEARLLAELDHPHIVPVYDVVRLDDGRYVVASKLIAGRSLKEQIERQRPSPAAAAEIVATVADALAYAHRRGLVHRDVKPANILLDDRGQPILADFGLAVREDDQWQRSGEVSGSPGYMAPEQVRGEAHYLDGRTDVWALGVVLYELLTGRRPFRGRTTSELFAEIQQRDPKPPRMIDPSMPEALERIVLRCLRKAPPERYATAADMAADLRRWLADAQPGQPAGRDASNRRRVALASAAALVALAVLAAVVWVERRGEQPGDQLPRAAHVIDPPAVRLDGSVDVLVAKRAYPELGIRSALHDAPDILPLEPNDSVRLVAELSLPMYAYLVWVDAEGTVQPIYPWRNFDWGQRPEVERPVQRLSLPEQPDEAWPIVGRAGREMIVLLASDRPLPPEFDFPGRLGDFPHDRLADAPQLVVVLHATDAPAPGQRSLGEARRLGDPVLQARAYLDERLGADVQLLRALSVMKQGAWPDAD